VSDFMSFYRFIKYDACYNNGVFDQVEN